MPAELEDVWEISKTPEAKYELKYGMLILSTEATAGNIYLWYKDAILPGEPIAMEARINPGTAENAGDGMVYGSSFVKLSEIFCKTTAAQRHPEGIMHSKEQEKWR